MLNLACIAVLHQYGIPAGKRGAEFDTNNILPILTRAQDDSPDVLLIYDCCHSLSSRLTNDKPSRAIVECLFAGGFETEVPIPGQDSFTYALIQELLVVGCSPAPVSVTDLHRKIIDRLQNCNPGGLFNEDGTIRRDVKTQKPIVIQPVRITPIHMFLSENKPPRTIFLAPKKEQRTQTSESQHNYNNTNSSAEHTELPRVLLAVRLAENEFNPEAIANFEKWILNAPQCVVKFERLYQSYSELLLIEVPLQVWDLLPRNPAITFIGFTKGEKPINTSTANVDSETDTAGNPLFRKDSDVTKGRGFETQLPKDSATDQPSAKPKLFDVVEYPNFHIHNEEIKEDRGLVTVLGAIDKVLPEVFTNLEKNGNTTRVQVKTLFEEVLENLIKLEVPGEGERGPNNYISKYEAFLFQYISAKHLIRYGPSWLSVENRLTGTLARIYDWYDEDDIEANSTSIPEIGAHETSSEPSTKHSKLWSNPSTGGKSSVIVSSMQGSTPDISRETVLQKKPLDNRNEPAHETTNERQEKQPDPSSDTAQNTRTNLEKSTPQQHITTETPDLETQNSNTGIVQQKFPKITYLSQYDLQKNSKDRQPEKIANTGLTICPGSAEDKLDSEVQRTGMSTDHKESLKDHQEEPISSTTSPKSHLAEPIENEQSPAIVAKSKVVSFDTSLKFPSLDLDLDSDSDSDSSVSSGLTSPIIIHEVHDRGTESEVDYPTIKSRHATVDDSMETASVMSFVYPSVSTGRVSFANPGTFLDTRYQLHKNTEFQPGRVLKLLWTGQTDSEMLGVKPGTVDKFYFRIRRFIIIATEEGHSSCVPILTYGRRGCTQSGVNPKTHGIVYSISGNQGEREPRPLQGEPELGFPPIKVAGYKDDEPLPKESRVNYAKLITIEHNMKIFFIGFIPLLDFGRVVQATNECWEDNMQRNK
ncbi:hypothetical protein F4805DRAFT_27162 [Annulohypoxylon moriforme]|nr:hypothetical protein F4805DRAFT_27162 [Annulohypoxylon moriforme]